MKRLSVVISSISQLSFRNFLLKGRARNNFGIFEQVKSSSTPSPNVQHLIEIIEDHLGSDFKMIKNKNGDPIFINALSRVKCNYQIQKNPLDILDILNG